MISGARDRIGAAATRARAGLMLAVQAGLAAGLAWYVAHDLIGRPVPFFAPVAAVITLGSSVGQRMRRTAELVLGVAVGIGLGDGLVILLGTGPWQIGVMVLFAVLVATTVGGGAPLIVQSASSAVLVATLTTSTGQPWTRFFDALVGGGIGLAVMTVLLPINPLSVVRRAADPALRAFTAGLHEAALGLSDGDPDVIQAALTRLRSAEGTFAAFRTAIDAARENVAFAPARWRARGALAQYVEGAPQLTYALRNVRVMIRRAQVALNDRERVPEMLPASVRHLGDAVELLRMEWSRGVEPVATRERALRAAAESGRAYGTGVGYSGGVVVAQIRTSVADLLRATGVEYAEATRQVRAAVGWQARPLGARRRTARARPVPPPSAPPEPDAG
ncbi:FUSC family protein [Actinoplanes palleronii]|uniref:FUSC family protein n=1 Tax=Actinoplanes palleronii TaxID=113570 RepID=A0ABQ4BJS9_9ACTN|nr:FUSC family protein [Actinoplanes palleronii]GIE70936.1 FUSC family protein [Actinoplanes palleronii]